MVKLVSSILELSYTNKKSMINNYATNLFTYRTHLDHPEDSPPHFDIILTTQNTWEGNSDPTPQGTQGSHHHYHPDGASFHLWSCWEVRWFHQSCPWPNCSSTCTPKRTKNAWTLSLFKFLLPKWPETDGKNLGIKRWAHDHYTPESTKGWRAPKWWGLEKVVLTLNMAHFGILVSICQISAGGVDRESSPNRGKDDLQLVSNLSHVTWSVPQEWYRLI